MKKRTLILIMFGWVLLTLYNYYYANFFILGFELILILIILFVASIVQIIKLAKERKNISKYRIQKAIIFISMFVLTLFHNFTNKIIEKADWYIFENKRNQIVKEVKSGKLNPNVEWNSL